MELKSSKIHQTGMEITNNKIYFLKLLFKSEVPLRKKTNASRVRQKPSHNGKKPHAVLNPDGNQFRNQKIIIRTMPSQPYKGNF